MAPKSPENSRPRRHPNRSTRVWVGGLLTLGLVGGGGTTIALAATRTSACTIRVDPGDNLSGIAALTGQKTSELANHNKLQNLNLIQDGEELNVCVGKLVNTANRANANNASLTDPIGMLASPERASRCPDADRAARVVSVDCKKFMQQVLSAAHYRGTADDGNGLDMAVRTYQAAMGLDADGDNGPITSESILTGRGLPAVAPPGYEVFDGVLVEKAKRLAMVIRKGGVIHEFTIVVGDGRYYSEVGTDNAVHAGYAITPTGDFVLGATGSPTDESALGKVPYYTSITDYGIGIHASLGIDATNNNASHGCIRVTFQDMLEFNAETREGDLVHIVE